MTLDSHSSMGVNVLCNTASNVRMTLLAVRAYQAQTYFERV